MRGMRRGGDTATRRRGDAETLRAKPSPRCSASPNVSDSPRHRVAASPCCLFITSARLLLLVAFLAVGVLSTHGQGIWSNKAARDNYCTVCHSSVQVELQESAHAREGINCVECHGGDPKAQTVAGAHSTNFRRTFDRKQIVELCARCHSDQSKMKPYGIPTDQHALYLTSVHGQKLMKGDSNVAVCSDCHSAHRVLAAKDPKSPVFRENIPQTCGRCHANAELMKPYNLSAGIVTDYQESAHGKALLERHNRQAPECTRCHGTHGAAPPGIGDVAKVCGQCHTKTLESFRQSPHKSIMAASGQAECASCHSNHLVEHASHALWGSSCSNCHAEASAEADRGTKIQALFVQAEAELSKAKESVDNAKRVPLDVTDYEARLSDALTYLVEARPVSHDLKVDDVEDLTRRARSIAQEVQSDVHRKMNVFGGRTIILILVWFYILISIAVVRRFRRTMGG
ncbi:MAG TPA: multiheme c-type cytochrome [Blastocatellia bacterium]|nr:multiheme c-type cytochrome [Blastocatellia bacterium]